MNPVKGELSQSTFDIRGDTNNPAPSSACSFSSAAEPTMKNRVRWWTREDIIIPLVPRFLTNLVNNEWIMMKVNVDEMQCRIKFRDQCKEKDLSLKHRVLKKNPTTTNKKQLNLSESSWLTNYCYKIILFWRLLQISSPCTAIFRVTQTFRIQSTWSTWWMK